MINLLICSMLLMPPSTTEVGITKHILDNGKIEYRLPNGFGIDDIRVIVSEGKESEGLQQARVLYDMLHRVYGDGKRKKRRRPLFGLNTYKKQLLKEKLLNCFRRSQ